MKNSNKAKQKLEANNDKRQKKTQDAIMEKEPQGVGVPDINVQNNMYF